MIAPFAHVGGVPVEEMIPAAAGAGGALALARAYVWMALRRENRWVRDAYTAIGRLGLPVCCASTTAPCLNSCTGPRGPSGVIAGETCCFTIAS